MLRTNALDISPPPNSRRWNLRKRGRLHDGASTTKSGDNVWQPWFAASDVLFGPLGRLAPSETGDASYRIKQYRTRRRKIRAERFRDDRTVARFFPEFADAGSFLPGKISRSDDLVATCVTPPQKHGAWASGRTLKSAIRTPPTFRARLFRNRKFPAAPNNPQCLKTL